MRAGVFSGDALADADELVERVLASPRMVGADLAGEVTAARDVRGPGRRRDPVPGRRAGPRHQVQHAADDGPARHRDPRAAGAATLDDVLAIEPDGVFLANGPGDPATADGPVALTQGVLEQRIPLFGICFGNQILGRALGRGTYKLRYGHRGINIPVIDVATGRVAITAQNHGFALEGEPGQRFDTPFGAARDQPLLPERRLRRGRARPGRARVLRPVPPGGGGRPARRRPAVRRVRRPDGGELSAQARRHRARPGDRVRPDRDRAGLRVRLLGHPGVPGAARGGPAGQPGQLQPGDDHDRPGVRRRHLHRADHRRLRREGDRERAPGRAAGHARRADRAEHARSRCTSAACWRSTASS